MNTQQLAGEALRNAAYSAKQTIKANIIAALVKANPHLIQPGEKSHIVTAAKNIRIELKRAFPGVKFSVVSRHGTSINVDWTDGPTSQQVEAIADKYAYGSFDGMTDCYNYSGGAWAEAFGGAQYVFTHRDYSDAMLTSVIGRTCRYYGGLDAVPTAEDYRKGRIWNLHNSGGCDMSRAISQALQKHTYCITRGEK